MAASVCWHLSVLSVTVSVALRRCSWQTSNMSHWLIKSSSTIWMVEVFIKLSTFQLSVSLCPSFWSTGVKVRTCFLSILKILSFYFYFNAVHFLWHLLESKSSDKLCEDGTRESKDKSEQSSRELRVQVQSRLGRVKHLVNRRNCTAVQQNEESHHYASTAGAWSQLWGGRGSRTESLDSFILRGHQVHNTQNDVQTCYCG